MPGSALVPDNQIADAVVMQILILRLQTMGENPVQKRRNLGPVNSLDAADMQQIYAERFGAGHPVRAYHGMDHRRENLLLRDCH